MASTDAVLLIAFGGPTRPEEIRPFLENVTRGRRIPPERLDEVVRHHHAIVGPGAPPRSIHDGKRGRHADPQDQQREKDRADNEEHHAGEEELNHCEQGRQAALAALRDEAHGR